MSENICPNADTAGDGSPAVHVESSPWRRKPHADILVITHDDALCGGFEDANDDRHRDQEYDEHEDDQDAYEVEKTSTLSKRRQPQQQPPQQPQLQASLDIDRQANDHNGNDDNDEEKEKEEEKRQAVQQALPRQHERQTAARAMQSNSNIVSRRSRHM